MSKFNLVKNNEGAPESGGDNMVLDLSQKLNLVVEDPPLAEVSEIDTDQPYTTALDTEPTVGQIAMEPPVPTEDEALVLEDRQQDIEASQSLQQLHGGSLGDYGPKDIHNIAGPTAAPHFIDAVKRLQQTDSTMLPFDEVKSMESVKSMMGVERGPAQDVAVDGDKLDMRTYVDKQKTKPLNSAELFGHMDAFRFSGDSRVTEVLPDFQILNLALMESVLSAQAESESMVPQDMLDNFSPDEIADLTGSSISDLESGVSEGQIGRELHAGWLKFQQVRDEGIDTVPDAHLNPANEMTKEAYEKLGMWAKQAYSLGNPHMYQAVQTKTANGTRGDYLITPLGRKILEQNKKELWPPEIKARPQVSANPQPTSQYSNQKQTTGLKVKDKRKNSPEDQLRVNSSKVRHHISPVRLKAGMILSLVGVGKSASMQMVDGNVKVEGNAAEMLGIGQKAADKINNMSRNASLRAESMAMELQAMSQSSPKAQHLANKIEILRAFSAESADAGWKERAYRRKATQALEMLQDIAEFSKDPISFTNYIQNGTSRLGYSAQKMNPQIHKLARQLYGSGTKYQIKPGSNSNAEVSLLITLDAHFFAEGNAVPEQMIRNMRKRISMKDDKLMSISNAGRKLKGILNDYDVDATTDALKQMTQVDNQIRGVSQVMETLTNIQQDPEVARFLDVAFDHPNETINLIEEAIELSRYMDTIERGGSFSTMFRPVEIDGISNGIASVSAQLGLQGMMHRVGVLRTDPKKILAEFDGVEGKIIKVLAKNMRDSLPDLVNSFDFSKDFDVDINDLAEITDLVELAIANESEFLKPPLMTIVYGQAIKSMLGTVMNAVTSDPALNEMAELHPLGVLGVSRMLHRVLEYNLEMTLDPKIFEFIGALTGTAEVVMLVDEPLIFDKATGSKASIGSSEYIAQEGSPVISQIREKYVTPKNGVVYGDPSKKHPSTIGSERLTRTKYQPTTAEVGSLGKKSTGASKTKAAILPQVAISNDGSVVANTFSGSSYTRIQKESGSEVPYFTPIYDAVVADAGSFMPIMNAINREWVKATMEYDLLRSIADGANEAYKRGAVKLSTKASKDPQGLMSNRLQAEHMLTKAHYLLPKGKDAKAPTAKQKAVLGILKDTSDRFAGLPKSNYHLTEQAHMLTNAQALELFKIMTPDMKYKLQMMYDVAGDAKVRRNELRKVLGSNHVFEYSVDALKSFDFN